MEMRIWMGGVERIVGGVSEKTTNRDIVAALARSCGRTGHFKMAESWRKTKRYLKASECPLEILRRWSGHGNEIRFMVYSSVPRDRNYSWGGGRSNCMDACSAKKLRPEVAETNREIVRNETRHAAIVEPLCSFQNVHRLHAWTYNNAWSVDPSLKEAHGKTNANDSNKTAKLSAIKTASFSYQTEDPVASHAGHAQFMSLPNPRTVSNQIVADISKIPDKFASLTSGSSNQRKTERRDKQGCAGISFDGGSTEPPIPEVVRNNLDFELTTIEKELKKLEAKLHRRRNTLDRMETYNLELDEELSKLEAGDWKGVFIRAKDEERQLKNEIMLVRYDEEIIQNKINERQTEAQKITQEIYTTSNVLNEQALDCRAYESQLSQEKLRTDALKRMDDVISDDVTSVEIMLSNRLQALGKLEKGMRMKDKHSIHSSHVQQILNNSLEIN